MNLESILALNYEIHRMISNNECICETWMPSQE